VVRVARSTGDLLVVRGLGMGMRGRGGEGRGVVLDCPFGEAMVGSWGGCGGMEGSCWSWMSFVMLELGVFGGGVWSRVCPAKMDVKSPS
jgi:hypothetical protein